MPNKLSQFWQDLKRRNVVRVITVYAGAAFVIIELINNITEPLKLPEWAPTLVIVLLAIGFPIVIIFSWIYDIHPEGGMVKTEPVDKIKTEDIPKSSNGWKIASYVSFVVIVGLIVLNIVPHSSKKSLFDKSIAVLPFINESPELDDSYLINGYRTEVHNNLCQIKELRVFSLESAEQYRNQTKSFSEIAKELDVGYLLTARGTILNDRIRLTVQLAGANDATIWSKSYNREVNLVEDHMYIQSEIAQLAAGEIQAVITPEEKQRMEKIPTTNSLAWEFYQRGLDKFRKSTLPGENIEEALRGAEEFFNYALEYDSTLALAYAGLARVYYDLNRGGESYFSVDFLDTVLILADRALSFDPQLPEAHSVKGQYYRKRGNWERSLVSYERALELNPNDWSAYDGMGLLYQLIDLVKAIDYNTQAILRTQGPILSVLYADLGYNYYAAGFMDKGDSCNLEALELNGDTIGYKLNLMVWYGFLGEFEKGLEFIENQIPPDSLRTDYNYFLGIFYSNSGQFEKAVHFLDRYVELREASGMIDVNEMHRIGYAHWMAGDKEKGAYYLNKQKAYCEHAIELGRDWGKKLFANYDLAGVYAFQGEREKAYENLRIFNQRDKMSLWDANTLKYDPLFNSIRDEPEFQQIARDIEAKYQAEHERVRQWLEDNDML